MFNGNVLYTHVASSLNSTIVVGKCPCYRRNMYKSKHIHPLNIKLQHATKKNTLFDNIRIFRRSLIYQTKEFFHNSTLHGVRYITESGRPTGEKFMWFCFTVIGTIAALVIIMSLWEKFQTNPTITGLDTDFHNQQVLFPTTVICPESAYEEDKVAKLAEEISPDNQPQIEAFLKMLPGLGFDNLEEANSLGKRLDLGVYDLRKFAFDVSISCSSLIDKCKYRDEDIDCCTTFDTLYTENGFCYGFNTRFKSKPDKDELNDLAPYDLYETDKKWAFEFVPNRTAKVYIFPYEEYFGGDFKSQLDWIEDQQSDILISKRSTYTTDEARQLTIQQRKCIFYDEVQLKYYTGDYTFSACMKECRINKVIHLCKCVPPFYKPIRDQPSCKISDFDCLIKYKRNITNLRDCKQCELSCSKTEFNIEKLNKIYNKAGESRVQVEFLTWPIIRYKREVLFGWVDLLVSFGGIAGLFLGFSLLSGVEIIYFFTLRACCMVYRNKKDLERIEMTIRRQPPRKVDLNLLPRRRRPIRSLSNKVQVQHVRQLAVRHTRANAKDFSGYARGLYSNNVIMKSNNNVYHNYLP